MSHEAPNRGVGWTAGIGIALLAAIMGAPCVAHAGGNTELKAQCDHQNLLDGTVRPLVDVERACQHRLKAFYTSDGETLHPIHEAWLAYRLAVFERVDQGQMSPIQAAAVLSDIKRRLDAEIDNANAARRAEWLERRRQWDRDLQETLRAFDRPSRTTADCTTSWIGNIASTTCR